MSRKPASARNAHECPLYTPDTYEWQSSTGYFIANVHGSLRRALDAELAQFSEVSSAQWVILMVLKHQPDVTAAALAKRLSYDPGSMTRLLDRLQEKGLIRRTRADEDRRRILIELTDEGRKLTPSLPKAAINAINRSLNGFTADEHAELNRLLTRMLDNLKDSHG